MNKDSAKDKTMEHSQSNNDLWLAESLNNHLNTQVEALDYTVTSKLSAARHRALASEPRRLTGVGSSFTWFSPAKAFGGMGALMAIGVLGFQMYTQGPANTAQIDNHATQQVFIEDLNLLSASDDLEFYQSLEFLEWMESNSG